MKNKENRTFIGAGILAAFASSLCCITPLVAILGGVSGGASIFSFIEPARSYLIGISIIALGFAFYQAYRPRPVDDCGCEIETKTGFLNSKGFLWTVTVLSIFLFSLPYSNAVFSSNDGLDQLKIDDDLNTNQYIVAIEGMTCEGCENHVISALSPLTGVASVKADYSTGTAHIAADTLVVSFETMAEVLRDESGYSLTSYQIEKE